MTTARKVWKTRWKHAPEALENAFVDAVRCLPFGYCYNWQFDKGKTVIDIWQGPYVGKPTYTITINIKQNKRKSFRRPRSRR